MLMTIVVFVVVLGFLVLIHEGGHFLAARWARVWVHEFAIGFGPAFFKRKGKETLYALRIFPLGGYVRMAGESEPAGEDQGDNEAGDVPHDRLFSSQSPWARLGIIFAGPLTNIVGAVLLVIAVVAAFGAPQVEVVKFTASDSPAAQVLHVGDIITSIEGKAIYSTSQIQNIVGSNGERPLTIGVLRNGEPVTIEVTPRWVPEQGGFLIGAFFSTAQTNLITNVEKGSFLDLQGVQKGDRLVALDDVPVSSARTLFQAFEQTQKQGGPQSLTVLRQNTKITVPLNLEQRTPETIFGGISLETPTRTLNPIDSVSVGVNQTWSMMVAWVQGIRRVTSGEIPAGKAFSGPVGIASILGKGFEQGWSTFFFLVAFLSLNLGVINLLPFPALDGSRLVFIAIELVRGKPVSPEREGMVHQIGFFILLGLIVLITYNDIARLFQ